MGKYILARSYTNLISCFCLIINLCVLAIPEVMAFSNLQGLKLLNGFAKLHTHYNWNGTEGGSANCSGRDNNYYFVTLTREETSNTIYGENSSETCVDSVENQLHTVYFIADNSCSTCVDNITSPYHFCYGGSKIKFWAGGTTRQESANYDDFTDPHNTEMLDLLGHYEDISRICSAAPQPSGYLKESTELSSAYTFKINCNGGKKAQSITVVGAHRPALLINGLPPVSVGIWEIPLNANCGDTITLISSAAGVGQQVIEPTQIRANLICTLKINDFSSNKTIIEPSIGETVAFNSTLSHDAIWTLVIGSRRFTGIGASVSVTWDGKDASGKIVEPGAYVAKLTVTTADGTCTDSKSIPITVESTCDLEANITGPGSDLAFSAGGSYPLTGSYATTSSSPVNWALSLPDGSTQSGTGLPIGYSWDGTLGDGTLATAGTYQAKLTVTSSADSACTATKELPIKVYTPPDSCGLKVDFGSSAHVTSGNLSHSQDLFSVKGGAQPLGLSLYYNSRDSHNASMGRGWSHSYDVSLKQNSDGSVLISEPNWKYEYYTFQNGAYVGQPGNYPTLEKKSDGAFTLTARDGQVSTFTSAGRLTSISDRNGNVLNLAYSGNNLASVTDPAGRKATFVYDGTNHLTSVTDPSGNIYTFSITGKSLASVTQPDGGKWQYTYDANAFMLAKSDPLGNVTTYTYDDRHRVVSSIDPEGRTRNIAYPQTSDTVKSTTFTEKDGGVWQYSYDTQKGTLASKTDPQGGVTIYTYDAAGNRTSTTNPDGTTTTATYDTVGNMLTSTDALGQTTGYTYNAFGQVTGIIDPQGGTTGYVYDAKGNMTSLTDATGATTTYANDAKGNVTKMTDAAGQATTFTYNANGNLASITDPAGAVTTYAYDAVGNVISITDTKGAITQFVYDNRNRLIKTIDPQGNATLYSYDVNGNKLSETDANGNTTTFEYNSRNQLVRTTDALGSVTTYAYGGSTCPSCGGGADKLTAITDANGNITSYLYDQLGRSVKEADPLGNSIAYVYDARNNPVSKIDANGNTIKYSYDANGRLLKKSHPDGTEETFTYDAKGNILTAGNRHISYTFTYDAAGRVKSVSDSTGKVISYEYDLLGNKTKMISPEGKSLTYAYDNANRLASIINGGTFSFGYDTKGQRTSLVYPNGDTATYGYDKQGRLTSLMRKNSAGNVISSNSYSLDKIGNRQTNTTQDRTSSYSYDNVYRLTQALTNTPGYSTNTKGTNGTTNAVQQQKEIYSYDPVGNRLTSANNRSYSYGPGNQLTSENGTIYSYDKNGNLIQKTTATETTIYAWDFENRLIKATTPTTTSEYAYDPFGRRMQKKVSESSTTTTTNYFYDGQAILFDYDETGTIGNRYIHGPNIDEPLAVTTGKDKYYYHADGLGSIIALTDQAGKNVQTYEYDSFGNLKDQKNRIKQPFTYTGREWDKEAGLYYYRARYYDPMKGRFISKDPIGFDGGDVNLYGYVQNNPINWIDPFGLIKYNKPPPDTVPVSGATERNILCVEWCLSDSKVGHKLDLLLTGGAEKTGHTGKNSHHYKGEACDIAGPKFNDLEDDDVFSCAKQCGFQAGQFEEFSNHNRDHWHLQLQPGYGVPAL